ncbi:MAG: hypothetical protein ACR2JJ_05690 [Sphingomicrobium sp.]
MHKTIPLVLIAALAGCTMGPPQPPTPLDARQQTRLDQLLGGKVAGMPQSCLSSWRTQDMTVIDDSTIIFRESSNKVWLQKPQGPCDRLSSPSYALVTRSTQTQLCRGDIGQVLDPTTNITAGSCVMGDFVPYTRPGA